MKADLISLNNPVLFLDIDGTICPDFTQTRTLPNTWEQWQRLLHPNMWDNLAPVYFAKDMVFMLEKLPMDRLWLTTWQSKVDEWGMNEAMGWSIDWIPLSFSLGGRFTKLDPVQYFCEVNPHTPFVWIDDDYAMDMVVKPWAKKLPVPNLIIRTSPKIGITPQDIKQVEKFCKSLSLSGLNDEMSQI